ncbi:hypothetical protein QYE76_039559 [Lolium multiflorum]|uniref:Uncharacterized protein n=1 Tax=Lolium multiflorum TaxID=4521 RepID=A0AAD8TA39_LOLMU|nr:hypothetical protein QYE76_039559 [Lolium multiflorum]
MELQVVCAATSGKEQAQTAGDALPKATKILEDRLHLNPSVTEGGEPSRNRRSARLPTPPRSPPRADAALQPPRAATEDDGADSPAASGLRATPPRPNKRSSRAKSSSRRRRSPNPNPRPRPDYYGTEPSRKSERKRKPRSFPDAALLSRALLPRASPSRAGGGGNVQLWTDADELALLSGAVAFRAGSGRAPRLPDTGPLFESIRDSLSPHIDQSKVYLRTPPWSPMLSKSCLSPAAFSSAFTEFRNSGPSPGLPMAPPRTSPESST